MNISASIAPLTALPQIPETRGIIFVAISTLIMAYSTLIGTIPILILYAMWLPYIFYKRKFTLTPSLDIALPLVYGIFCITSTIWSDYPSVSLYAGTQYISMIVCAVIIARIVRFETFIKGLSLGVFFVLLAPYHTGSFVIEGLFGSKNQAGYFAQIGILTSLLLFFHIKKAPGQTFIFAILPFAISTLSLVLSNSVSSIISAASVLGISGAMYGLTLLPKQTRPVLMAFSILGLATFAIVISAFNIDMEGEVLEFFGKDRTLTGRTDLWQYGLQLAQSNPVLGVGYSALWVVGQPDAERLWAEFFINTKTGFHFHNLYIESWVELGLIGLTFIVGMLTIFCIQSIRPILKQPPSLEIIFSIGVAFMFISRSFVEVDLLNSYGIGPLLFFSVFPRLFHRKAG